jgi:[ribosomal protein S5]-alanine N-acetyltransferase
MSEERSPRQEYVIGMIELRTERLVLTRVVPEDAAFILELLNDPGWIANIGDRGARNLEDARAYIEERISQSLWFVGRNGPGDSVGIYSLLDREGLLHPDIGFATLSRFAGLGYATEGATALLHHAKDVLEHDVILAITKPHNVAARRVLRKIGLRFLRLVQLRGYDIRWALYTTQIGRRTLQRTKGQGITPGTRRTC